MLNFLGIKTALSDLIEAVKAADIGAALKNVSVLTALLAPLFGGMQAAGELSAEHEAAKAELPVLKAQLQELVVPKVGMCAAAVNWDVVVQIASLVLKLLETIKS